MSKLFYVFIQLVNLIIKHQQTKMLKNLAKMNKKQANQVDFSTFILHSSLLNNWRRILDAPLPAWLNASTLYNINTVILHTMLSLSQQCWTNSITKTMQMFDDINCDITHLVVKYKFYACIYTNCNKLLSINKLWSYNFVYICVCKIIRV